MPCLREDIGRSSRCLCSCPLAGREVLSADPASITLHQALRQGEPLLHRAGSQAPGSVPRAWGRGGAARGCLVLPRIPPLSRQEAGLANGGLRVILTDLVWFPLYEEVSYRGFFLGVFARRGGYTTVNLALNLAQALLFVSVHHHHVSAGLPLLLIPIFLLGLLNGLVFLRSWNVVGCVLGHVLVNGLALLLLSMNPT